jgi:hypothetical protein
MINVTESFDAVIRELGGEIVSDLVGMSPLFENADYLLREYGAVIELKCLDDDRIKNKSMLEQASALYARELKKRQGSRDCIW